MMQKIFIIVTTFCLVLNSCSKKDSTGNGDNPVVSGYTILSVQNGGAISGKVSLGGEGPEVMMIETQKDQGVCGVSHRNPSAPGNGSGIEGCVVYLEKVKSGKAFPAIENTVDQTHCTFIPHIVAGINGSKIIMKNSDDALHNYHVRSGENTITNEAQPPGVPPREVTLSASGILSVNCDVHPWMKGYIFSAENPYYAITDTSGNFSISDIPEGDYTLILWRDNWNTEVIKDNQGRIQTYKTGPDFIKKQQIHIDSGQTVSVDFMLP